MSYIALFMTTELSVIGTKKFKVTDTFVTFKKGTFNIRLDAIFYRTGNTTYYGYIYPTDEKLLIDVLVEPIKNKTSDNKTKMESARLIKIKEKIEHGDLHFLVAESIIGQLARAFLQTVKTNWVYIILALGMGIGIGYGIGISMPHQATATIIANATQTPLPTVG